MNTRESALIRNSWVIGLAALGLAVAAPVQAAPDFLNGAFIVAKQDHSEETRTDQRDAGKDERRASKRKADRDEPEGYGYGYERRQQQRSNDESRSRGRH
jgi:hypothetical protein